MQQDEVLVAAVRTTTESEHGEDSSSSSKNREEFPVLSRRRRASSYRSIGKLKAAEETDEEDTDPWDEDDTLGSKRVYARRGSSGAGIKAKNRGMNQEGSYRRSMVEEAKEKEGGAVFCTGTRRDPAVRISKHNSYGLVSDDEESKEGEQIDDGADEAEEGNALGDLDDSKRRSSLRESILPGCRMPDTDITSIKLNQYSLQAELGRGSQAIVFKAKNDLSGAPVALRVVRGICLRDVEDENSAITLSNLRAHSTSAALLKATRTELAILRRANHPQLVHFADILDLEAFDKSVRGIAIVTDFFGGEQLLGDEELEDMDGDFWDLHTKTTAREIYPESECRQIFAGILAGLEYMHYHGIYHGDVKPSNVLYNKETGQLKLIDFGVSRVSEMQSTHTDISASRFRSHSGWGQGTLLFFCPESCSLAPGATYDASEADVWAACLTAYVLLFGHLPLRGVSERGDLIQLMSQGQELPVWKPQQLGIFSTRTSRGGAALLKKCLLICPYERLRRVSDIMKDPWMEPAMPAYKATNGALSQAKRFADDLTEADLDNVANPVTDTSSWNSFKERFGHMEASFKFIAAAAAARLSDFSNKSLEERLSNLSESSKTKLQAVKEVAQKDLERAAVRIQSIFRMHSAQRLANEMQVQKSIEYAATKIQSLFRMRYARHQATEMRKHSVFPEIKIVVASRAKEIAASDLEHAALSIQSFYRRRLSKIKALV